MTEDEMNKLVESINSYWTTPHPKTETEEAPDPLTPVHDFDNIKPFTEQAHVDAVRAYYEQWGRENGYTVDVPRTVDAEHEPSPADHEK